MPALGEVTDFLLKYLHFSEEKIINTLLKCQSIFVTGMNGDLKAVMTFRQVENGHHIHFMVAIDKSSRKTLVKEGLRLGVTPVSAVRHGKIKIYKNPMKLAQRIG